MRWSVGLAFPTEYYGLAACCLFLFYISIIPSVSSNFKLVNFSQSRLAKIVSGEASANIRSLSHTLESELVQGLQIISGHLLQGGS
jgi:hypothetical protein